METEQLLKTKDVAEMFSVSAGTVRNFIKKGKLPYYKINPTTFRYDKDKVIEWVENQPK